jgi:maleate isomerase
LIVLPDDEVGEGGFQQYFASAPVRIATTRLRARGRDGSESPGPPDPIDTMQDAADRLPPRDRLGLVAFSCTSMTIELGLDATRDLLSTVWPGVPSTTPAHALREALRKLNARSIGLITPYPQSMHEGVADFWREQGFHIGGGFCFNLASDAAINDLPKDEIKAASRALARRGGVDALVLSCTGLRATPLLADLQSELQLPVLSSSQAMAWHAIRQLNISQDPTGIGSD